MPRVDTRKFHQKSHSLNAWKSIGADIIPPIVRKMCAPELGGCPLFLSNFQLIRHLGNIVISPVYERGNPSDLNNYCSPGTSKVFPTNGVRFSNMKDNSTTTDKDFDEVLQTVI